MYPGRRVVRLLRLLWAALLLYGELGIYYHRVGRCQWPDGAEAAGNGVARIAVVADPQIVDHYSYGQTGLLLRVVEFFTDIYMRKSYVVLQQLRRPEAAVFLGDLMDGGREWGDADWESEYQRYRSIFVNRRPNEMRVYEMAGNHDIGIGNTVVEPALARFLKRVGPTNQVFEAGGYQIALLDTLTLLSDDARVSNGSRQMVEWLAEQRQSKGAKPRILFTHVPLWRPDGTPCGPLRQSRRDALIDASGYQFRNELFENTTRHLLDAIQPDAVLSGDDHDTCTVVHTVPATGKRAPEYTIGAFGWASGTPVASYGLLTLHPGSEDGVQPPRFALRNCFLPYQLGIYMWYLGALAATLMAAAASGFQRPWSSFGQQFGQLRAAAEVDKARTRANDAAYLPLPATARAGWHAARLPFARHAVRIVVEVAALAVPLYAALLLFFYIV
ncbi:hypothetical protein H4R18_001167 [Coemansia javaensis]|uniref:Calcineurin-like phosphoesterase domain-containing protein n=1 Tax=Coemansia javaensis TaxID=2761396 RepID=A0A9W8HMD0_9FUNG|nr:hypothetical protein H4R18_001167 [Coemansia javaensis]